MSSIEEIRSTYQQLCDKFQKISSYEMLADFYQDLGKFSMLLSPEDKGHKAIYTNMLNSLKNRFSKEPDFQKHAQDTFATLPEEQQFQYTKLSDGNRFGMLNPQDYTKLYLPKEARNDYDQLCDKFQKINSYEMLADFYQDLGKFSMLLSPENEEHKAIYAGIMNSLKNRFSKEPDFQKHAQDTFATLPEEQRLQYAKLSDGNRFGMLNPQDYIKMHLPKENVNDYQQLCDKFQKINSYDALAQFYQDLGKFSMHLSPENDAHRTAYRDIMDAVHNRFSKENGFEKHAQDTFSQLPKEQQARYVDLAGNNYQMLNGRDYLKARTFNLVERANKRAETSSQNGSNLSGNEFEELVSNLSKDSLINVSKFADSEAAKVLYNDFTSGVNSFYSSNLERTKDIINSRMYVKNLHKVMETNDPKKIKDYLLANTRNISYKGLHDGEGLSIHKEKVGLLEEYLNKTKSQDEFRIAESKAQQYSALSKEASEAKNSAQEIYTIGMALLKIQEICQSGNIPVADIEKTLAEALSGENKFESMQNLQRLFETEKSLNYPMQLILCQKNAKEFLEPYGDKLLQNLTIKSLTDKFNQSRNDFQQKNNAVAQFEKENALELSFYDNITSIERVMREDQYAINEETKKREKGRIQSLDLEAKNDASRGLTPEEHYQMRKAKYYRAKHQR